MYRVVHEFVATILELFLTVKNVLILNETKNLRNIFNKNQGSFGIS